MTREIELGVMGDADADGLLVDIEFYRSVGAARTCRCNEPPGDVATYAVGVATNLCTCENAEGLSHG